MHDKTLGQVPQGRHSAQQGMGRDRSAQKSGGNGEGVAVLGVFDLSHWVNDRR